MGRFISIKDMLSQLRADLIGKDSYRGVTLTYAWLANQFGHFSLGFIPTIIIFVLLFGRSDADAAIRASVIVSIWWFIFEIFNFLAPLIFAWPFHWRQLFLSKDQIKKRYCFQPHWWHIAFDTLTDLLFFWVGAFVASLVCHSSAFAFIVLLVLILLLLFPMYYWYLTRMYLQLPHFPFQFRLSQWNFPIKEGDKKTVNCFVNCPDKGLHLLVFGPNTCGKTSISVGIATEISMKHKACIYTTAIKLYNMFFETDDKQMDPGEHLWTWRTGSLLVIDDINPGGQIKEDLVGPKSFLKYLDTYSRNETNRTAIAGTSVIWVLGNNDPGNEVLKEWKEMLAEIGINEQKVLSINLPRVEHA